MSTRQAILPILKPGETFRRSRAEQAVMQVTESQSDSSAI